MSNPKLADHSNDVIVYSGADILSYIINRYVETYQDFVYKDDFGKYVFTKVMSDRDIQSSFFIFFTEMVDAGIIELGEQSTIITFGSYPFMNWRRVFRPDIDDKNFQKIIDSRILLNYVMTDRTIKIDEVHLCKQINTWVNSCMEDKSKIDCCLNVTDNVKFMANKNISEEDIINITIALFGASRVSVRKLGGFIKSMEELNRYIYSSVGSSEMIPRKIVEETVYYLKLQLNQGDDISNEQYTGKEQTEDG